MIYSIERTGQQRRPEPVLLRCVPVGLVILRFLKMAHMNNKIHPRAWLVHEGSWGGASDPLPPVSRLRGQWRRTVAKGPASHGFVVFSRAVAKSDYVIERGVTIYGLTG